MLPFLIACTTCTPNQGGADQDAYIWMTVMMCLVPLFAIGGVVLWLRYEAQRPAADELLADKAGAPAEPPALRAGFER